MQLSILRPAELRRSAGGSARQACCAPTVRSHAIDLSEIQELPLPTSCFRGRPHSSR